MCCVGKWKTNHLGLKCHFRAAIVGYMRYTKEFVFCIRSISVEGEVGELAKMAFPSSHKTKEGASAIKNEEKVLEAYID